MIKNSCQKQAIRERMAQTGEDWNTAKLAFLEALPREAGVRGDQSVAPPCPSEPRTPGMKRELVGVGTPACRVIKKTPRRKVRTSAGAGGADELTNR